MSGHGGYSGIGGGVRGGTGATKVELASGGHIDLKDMPLKYGKYDQSLNKKQRETLDVFEKSHRDEKYKEHGILLDKNGNVIEEKVGKSGEVVMSSEGYSRAEVMSHNHNKSDSGRLGGTFSVADAKVFGKHDNLKTMRATSKEGTYSITKKKGFDKSKFVSYIEKEREKSFSIYTKREGELDRAYESGRMKLIDYKASIQKERNAHNVRMHNVFLQGQGKYGYDYTLERRRK